MRTTQNQKAKDLYFGTHKSQKQIAEEVGISEKTLYLWIKKGAWDEHKMASLAAPAIIVDNLCYMLVELQGHIAMRPEGNRYPTPVEVDTMRKLINSITKVKEYSSTGHNMQVMADFVSYIRPDEEFAQKLQLHAENYFNARKKNDRYPDHFAFGVQPPMTNEEEINAIKEELEARFGCHEEDLQAANDTGKNFPTEPEISSEDDDESNASKALQPMEDAHHIFPEPEKTGNIAAIFPSLGKEGWPQAGVVGLATDTTQKGTSPCHCGLE